MEGITRQLKFFARKGRDNFEHFDLRDAHATVMELIAPNLKRRLSGVTATIARLVPLQVQWIDIAATGPGLPESAVAQARETSSGMRSTWSISTAHLAMAP